MAWKQRRCRAIGGVAEAWGGEETVLQDAATAAAAARKWPAVPRCRGELNWREEEARPRGPLSRMEAISAAQRCEQKRVVM